MSLKEFSMSMILLFETKINVFIGFSSEYIFIPSTIKGSLMTKLGLCSRLSLVLKSIKDFSTADIRNL